MEYQYTSYWDSNIALTQHQRDYPLMNKLYGIRQSKTGKLGDSRKCQS